MLGGVLPWLSTGAGPVSGATGAGLWAFYAGALGLAGALVPWRRPAVVQAGILAVVAVLLPVWQLVHVYSLVGLQGWLPGPGLVMVLGGGVLAGTAARSLATGR